MNISDKMTSTKTEIILLLSSTKREGIDNILDYLEESGFYSAPSSVNRHHNWEGGLAHHSLGVYKRGLKLDCIDIERNSLIIVCLLHDICKASKLYYDENGNIHKRNTHIKGHGYRSVKLLEHYGLQLTDEERRTIRWHMGGHHASEHEKEEVKITRESILWKVLHEADQLDASGK